MTLPCLDLVSFADGELEPDRAEAFRAHLRTCAACRAGLVEAMQLGARLAALTQASEHVKLAPEPATGSPTESAPAPHPRSGNPRPKWKLRLAPWAGAALAAAALVTFFLRPKTDPGPVNPFAEVKTRPFDIRIAYADAASYRPPRGEMRGAGGSSRDISYAALHALEERKDTYGLAIAGAWNGDNPINVVARMNELAPTPSVRSDRAALEMLTTTAENVETILAELEALKGSADAAASRAAQWNHAILLARLELPLSAAKAFREIAVTKETGWADEARTRAEPEAKRGQDFQVSWDRAVEAATALVTTGAPVPAAVVAGMPGLIRVYFYDAVRTAPNRERVMALGSLAAELDRIDGHSILSDYVQRVAALDFHRRTPLASAYAQLRLKAQPTAAVTAELTTATASADVADIVMGAMFELRVIPDHLDAYRRMAKQTSDPWFDLILAQAEATADEQRSNWLGAEARLRRAQTLCTNTAVTFRCVALSLQLGTLYQKLHRVPEAVAAVHAGLDAARSSGDWGHCYQLLFLLADVERFNSSPATSRAYANEVLLMDPKSCEVSSPTYAILAAAAILDVDGRAARRSLDLALRCSAPDLSAASVLADIGRLDPQPGDLAQLQGWLTTLRTSGTLTAAERVLADAIEGRLLIESDRTAGTTLLERVIAAAELLPHDVVVEKARTGAYSVLVFDAARRADHARVVGLIAQELGLSLPGVCTVGMVAEDERAIVVVRGTDGRDHAAYETARRPSSGPLTVSTELARRLEGCTHVQVMAQADLQGQPRVLPTRLPWSYATGAHRGVSPQVQTPTEAQILIVTNVTPPSYLRLSALSPRAPDPTRSTHTLSGPDATPARVLAAMTGASEIQFHTHALVDMGVSNASHLVLSPGPDGSYALTAEAIRGIELRGRPVVVLAACHSAQGARYQHAPWSLPHAFLAAGARAVFAAGTAIPDADAGPFFSRVLERVRAGADPAVALRDEQQATLTSNPSSWVADVMLFE